MIRVLQWFFFFGCLAVSAPALALSLTQISQLSFGDLQIPALGTDTVHVDYDGTGTGGTATFIHNTASPGQYLLTGTESSGTISIDVQNISTGSPALYITNFKGRYGSHVINNFPAGGLPAPGSGAMLKLGADLTFASTVKEQPYAMYFDIMVNYE